MSSPTPLPITREEALERFREWCGGPHLSAAHEGEDFDDLAAAWGLTFAPEPPAPPEPPTWYDKPIQVEESEETPGFYYLMDTSGECLAAGSRPALPWLVKSHGRRLELEHDIEEGWRRSAQIDRGIIEEQRGRINALLAELAERTRERDDNLVGLERISDLYVLCSQELDKARAERDEARRGLGAAEKQVERLRGERDEHRYNAGVLRSDAKALIAERDELRRRVNWAGKVLSGSNQPGDVIEVPEGYLGAKDWWQRSLIAQVLYGQRPVPGEGGGEAP